MTYDELWEKLHDPRLLNFYPVFKHGPERVVLRLFGEPGSGSLLVFRRAGILWASTHYHELMIIPATEAWHIKVRAIAITPEDGMIVRVCGNGNSQTPYGSHWPERKVQYDRDKSWLLTPMERSTTAT